MRNFIFAATIALASCGAATPALAQDIPVRVVYEDMRLICGTENSTEYKVRVMREARQIRRELQRQGFEVMTIRLNAFDEAPAGLPARTRNDCRFN